MSDALRMTPEHLADAILQAAGSSLRHYTATSRAAILSAAEAQIAAHGILQEGLMDIRAKVSRSLDPAVWHMADGALRRADAATPKGERP